MKMLSERLRLAMEGPPKVSQVEIARYCGISPSSITKWLDGRTKKLEGANLIRAARFLRVNPLWLAEGRGSMRAEEGGARTVEPVDLQQWLDADEQELLAIYGRLSSRQQKLLLRFMRAFAVPGAEEGGGEPEEK